MSTSRRSPSADLFTLVAALAGAALLAGCSVGTAEPTASPAPVSACGSGVPTESPTDAASPDEEGSAVVSAEELCELDGRTWAASPFVLVINQTGWGETTAACDVARQAAWWNAWQGVQEAITTYDFGPAPEAGAADSTDAPAPTGSAAPRGVPDEGSLGSVGIAVLPAGAVDAAAADDATSSSSAVALLDAEVEACLGDGTTSGQTAVEHGDWRGVSGPSSSDDGVTTTWWTGDDDTWALVQTYTAPQATEAEVADRAEALETLLDAQLAHLTS
ncbi:hypothetical protein [Herbiconiux liukaitaii]|uniref:hypothetical protein n=1 Tax=Herbiconiux liukaitaii TaxID=3342799 RepID=UPI0035B9F404